MSERAAGRRVRLPARFGPILFGLLLSGFMSLIVSGVATTNARGLGAGFLDDWLTAWTFSWAIAFPAVLLVAPVVRRLVARLVDP